MDIELLEKLKKEKKSYYDMIKYCCDDWILNNEILDILQNSGYIFNLYCGNFVYYENNNGEEITEEEAEKMEDGTYSMINNEIYQYFIINENDAERLAKYTNEIVLYNDDVGLYLLCVTHYGTSWDSVPSNWKK